VKRVKLEGARRRAHPAIHAQQPYAHTRRNAAIAVSAAAVAARGHGKVVVARHQVRRLALGNTRGRCEVDANKSVDGAEVRGDRVCCQAPAMEKKATKRGGARLEQKRK
jgi:hypothetical protein